MGVLGDGRMKGRREGTPGAFHTGELGHAAGACEPHRSVCCFPGRLRASLP